MVLVGAGEGDNYGLLSVLLITDQNEKKRPLLQRALQIQSNKAGTKLETNSLLDSTQRAEGAMQAAVGSAVQCGGGGGFYEPQNKSARQ